MDWHTLEASLSPWYFGLSLAIYAAAQAGTPSDGGCCCEPRGFTSKYAAAIRLFFLGLFYNNLMPGSVGGDLVKAWYVTKHTDKRLEGVLSVFMDRVIGLFGMVLMAIFTYLAFVWGQATIWGGTGKTGAPEGLAQFWGVVLWAVAAVGAVLAALLAHPASRARLGTGREGAGRRASPRWGG